MFDHLFTDAQRRARAQARAFVKDTPRELILDMDAEKVRFPREWLREAARRGLLGVRHPAEWGGQGLDWVASCAVCEEIGTLSYELACVFGVGGDLVCDAISPRPFRQAFPMIRTSRVNINASLLREGQELIELRESFRRHAICLREE